MAVTYEPVVPLFLSPCMRSDAVKERIVWTVKDGVFLVPRLKRCVVDVKEMLKVL